MCVSSAPSAKENASPCPWSPPASPHSPESGGIACLTPLV